jgi:hypothetical protein
MRARCGALVLAAAVSGPNWRFLNWILPKKEAKYQATTRLNAQRTNSNFDAQKTEWEPENHRWDLKL